MSVSTTTLVTTIGNLSGEKEVRGWPEQFQAARYCGWKPVGPGQYQINPMTVWGCCSCMPGNGTPWLGLGFTSQKALTPGTQKNPIGVEVDPASDPSRVKICQNWPYGKGGRQGVEKSRGRRKESLGYSDESPRKIR
ncbi:hypothetical protein RRG08_020664 [Elysia crispata]|uniref:Uncharacterized protein n=1 Tax=Elysia crispata TaxID=231223 RepID=A0AAE1DAC0_9GAST|nr:hypothetical protein RRG08_020664 [Elysia crispata]